ncbi:GNAT family N-acetyltransferase [Caloramator proteoclasticus]|uniref:Acetyltransferase (GNAT) domain-containing protein n=1 Tax=Caloramator proteoclasticus DSM 10124 TaxID=1121262 RepID=A0A1M4SRI2_9CLOT|nr:GNAT family N-acetyltransferase [Caloramator proteoclasticus]SHE34752.1 Acetyltransferase (GNAT) domain-containing protein [Caloramator proteoclasticus DSM 10124]
MVIRSFNLFRLLANNEFINFYNFKNIFELSIANLFFNTSYFVMDEGIRGINKNSRVYIFIKDSSVSINEIINILINHYNNKKLNFEIKYINSNIKLDNSNKYIMQKNFKTMELELNNFLNFNSICIPNDIKISTIDISKNIDLRIDIQNSIFNSNDKKRRPIDKNYIYKELNSRYFLKDYCYVLFDNNIPIGYGQIIKDKRFYYLVNFGIIDEYRGKGYGNIFLNYILNDIKKKNEIKILRLNVDNYNIPAINLYKKIGFYEIYNTITLKSI